MQNTNPRVEIAPGITRQTVTHGRTMYQQVAELAAGSVMPEHHHSQEQIVYILRGRMRLIVAGEPHELATGDAFYLAGHVPHAVQTVEDTLVLDTFSPPRDDYLARDAEAMKR